MFDFNQIIQFIVFPHLKRWLLIFKIIFIFFDLILLVAIFILLLRTKWVKISFLINIYEFLNYRPFGIKKIAKQWTKIKNRLETILESEYKLAIIEADLMLDDVLKRMGYKGESLGERLKILTKDILANLDEVLEAHKVRNNIVHDPDFKLSLETAKRLISIYEKALVDLGVL